MGHAGSGPCSRREDEALFEAQTGHQASGDLQASLGSEYCARQYFESSNTDSDNGGDGAMATYLGLRTLAMSDFQQMVR